MLFNDIKVTEGQVYDFFSTRFDMRHLPEDVKVDRDGKIYYFEIGNDSLGKFKVDTSYSVDELSERNLEILDKVLNKTGGLHHYFMTTIQGETNSIIDLLDGDNQQISQQFPMPDQSKTVKEAQELRKQRTWRFFANEDAPGGIDTYVMVSSQICEYETTTKEIMRMIRTWVESLGLSVPSKERVTLWQMKQFLDEGWRTCPEYRERVWGSELFQEATQQIKHWVNCAWEKMYSSNLSPMSEAEGSFLNDPEFFLPQDDFFEGVWQKVSEIEKQVQDFMDDPNRMVNLEDYRLADNKEYVDLLTSSCTKSSDGKSVLGSDFMKAIEKEAKGLNKLLKDYMAVMLQKSKEEGFQFNPMKFKENVELIKDQIHTLSEIGVIASGQIEARNSIYQACSDDEKLSAEAEAEAALAAFMQDTWGTA